MSELRRNLLMAMNKTEPPITKDYLTIVALEDGLTAKLSVNACEYCVDGDGNWKTLPANTDTGPINAGQTLSFRGNLTPTSGAGIGTFTVSKYHNLKGNCMSMLFGDDAKDCFSLGKTYTFYKLFYNNTKLLNASGLVLQATTLANNCYAEMFRGCTKLIVSPKLPATGLAANCYSYMFYGCSSLINTPELSATTLANGCYSYMFLSCISLIKAVKLAAIKMVTDCYYNMFGGCNKLNYIKMLATSITATNCLKNWVNGVASTGMFVKNKDATWNVVGVSGVPNGWTVITE